MTEVHATGLTFQILSTPDRSYWLTYEVKGKDEPKARRYTEADAQAMADRLADHAVAWGAMVTFGDIWRTRSSGRLYDIEEGVAERWYKGRVVIVGDSGHKV
jgi:2-polyprenyl-6-methoxyphenol hydroxylase-like FAD-dependent oxidoreductase